MQFVPVLVAAVATMVLGFVWYSPLLFAKPWMRASGYDIEDKAAMEQMRKGAGILYLRTFLATLLAAFVLRWVFQLAGIATPVKGIEAAILICIGFVNTVQYTAMLFLRQHYLLFLINAGYQLASYAAMGAILGAWRVI